MGQITSQILAKSWAGGHCAWPSMATIEMHEHDLVCQRSSCHIPMSAAAKQPLEGLTTLHAARHAAHHGVTIDC